MTVLRPTGVTQADVDGRLDRLEAAGWRIHIEMDVPLGEPLRNQLLDPDGEFVVNIPLEIRNNQFMRLLDEKGVPG